jgi:hypothetical protein
MPHCIWLASYPKSGNTWFRLFLAALLNPGQREPKLVELSLPTPIASSRTHFDEALGMPSAMLTGEKIARLRPEADRITAERFIAERFIAENPGQQPLLRKVHDAYTLLADGTPMLGRGPDYAAIYILRDPWDVAVSCTNHYDCSLAEAVEQLCREEFVIANSSKGLANQLPQRLLSWQEHALNWLAAPMPLHLIRYEAMKNDPIATFRGAIRFLGLEHDDSAIAAALDAVRIDRLQQLEAEQRFRETPRHTARFFRRGVVGEGLERLTPAQLERLTMMKRRVDKAIEERQVS